MRVDMLLHMRSHSCICTPKNTLSRICNKNLDRIVGCGLVESEMEKEIIMIDQRYYKTTDAAKYLGIPESEMRRYARENRIPYSRPGGKIMLFDKADLDAFIETYLGK